MKTLKKTLCLVLAVVMAVGVLVIPASADYADADQIENKEAVAVLSGLGIINGVEDGSNFAPSDILNRAMAAKIINYVAQTPAYAKDYVGSTAQFTDVPAGYWAINDISYCASEGIINGDGAGNFLPEKDLTGHEFAKMLLCVIGYDAATEGLTGVGDDWKSNVEKLARAKDNNGVRLIDGLSGFNFSAPMSRDDACQMAYNALKVQTVSYEGGSEITLPGGITMKVGATVERNTSLNEDLYDNVQKSSTNGTDDFGHPSVVFTNESGDKIAELADTADKVYTAATKYSTILKDLGYALNDEVTITKIVDGVSEEVTGHTKRSEWAADTAKDAVAESGNGVLIEAYKENTSSGKAVRLVVTNTYITKAGTVIKAQAETATKPAVNRGVNLTVTNYKDESVSGSIDTETIEKDNIVLVTMAKPGEATSYSFKSIALAEPVEGTVSSKASDGSYIRVDGAQKYAAANMVKEELPAPGTTAKFYYDSYGYVLDYDVITEGAAAADYSYAYVLRYTLVAAGAAGETDLWGETADGKTATDAKGRAQIFNPETNAVEVIDLDVHQNDDGDWVYAHITKDGKIEYLEVEVKDETTPKIMAVADTGDGYAIGDVVAPETSLTSVKVEKGQAAVTNGAGKKVYANNSTRLVVITAVTEKNNTVSYSAKEYNGYREFVAVSSPKAALIVMDSNNRYITAIYVVVEGTAEPEVKVSTDYAILVEAGEVDSDGQYYTFLVDGEEVEYYGTTGLNVEEGKVYKLGFKNEALATATEAKPDVTLSKFDVDTDSYSDGEYITKSTESTVYYINANCVTYDAVEGTVISGLTDEVLDGKDVKLYKVGGSGNDKDEIVLIVIDKAAD